MFVVVLDHESGSFLLLTQANQLNRPEVLQQASPLLVDEELIRAYLYVGDTSCVVEQLGNSYERELVSTPQARIGGKQRCAECCYGCGCVQLIQASEVDVCHPVCFSWEDVHRLQSAIGHAVRVNDACPLPCLFLCKVDSAICCVQRHEFVVVGLGSLLVLERFGHPACVSAVKRHEVSPLDTLTHLCWGLRVFYFGSQFPLQGAPTLGVQHRASELLFCSSEPHVLKYCHSKDFFIV